MTSLKEIYNSVMSGNVSAVVTADLGSNFPVNATTVYEFTMFCAPYGGSTNIAWSCTNINGGVGGVGLGVTSTGNFLDVNLPANTVMLSPQLHVNNGTTPAAVAIDIARLYIEITS